MVGTSKDSYVLKASGCVVCSFDGFVHAILSSAIARFTAFEVVAERSVVRPDAYLC